MPDSLVGMIPPRADIEARMGYLSRELAIAKRLWNMALKAEQFRDLNDKIPASAKRPVTGQAVANVG